MMDAPQIRPLHLLISFEKILGKRVAVAVLYKQQFSAVAAGFGFDYNGIEISMQECRIPFAPVFIRIEPVKSGVLLSVGGIEMIELAGEILVAVILNAVTDRRHIGFEILRIVEQYGIVAGKLIKRSDIVFAYILAVFT